jgi:uncharacterized protein (DUF1800 family)
MGRAKERLARQFYCSGKTDVMSHLQRLVGCLAVAAALPAAILAQDKEAIWLQTGNGEKILDLPLLPGTEQYRVWGSPDLNQPFAVLNSGTIAGFSWRAPLQLPSEFFQVEGVPMSQRDMLSALVLSRLAYGPTPDELERVRQIGPDAYIAEQLAPETISEALDIDTPRATLGWERVVVTGAPTGSTLGFYLYLTQPGDVYIDDVKLVRGTLPDVGANLILNSGFESGFTSWTVSPNLINSTVTPESAYAGAGGLHMIADAGGSTRASSIYQDVANLVTGAAYTLSYWWKPGTNAANGLTVRFSGDGIRSEPESLRMRLDNRAASTDALRAWHVQHAVRSKKQLQEVLLQFLENHFVTQVSKSRDWLDQYLSTELGEVDPWAAHFEYKENVKWRAALNLPNCTFLDLLTISAESPAMIIYLDTVGSRGDGSNVPNENYARELLELFTFGVDNGYDQEDIVRMSRPWTGWSVDIVDTNQVDNPLAPRSTTLRPGGLDVTDRGDLAGVWTFKYKPERHWTRSGVTLFPGKTVPDRFGPPYAGRSYEYAVNFDGTSDWQRVVVTGTASSSTLYMYLTEPGDVYIDDLRLVAGTNPDGGINMIRNPGFETALTGTWNVSPNHAGSEIVSTGTHAGVGALHMVASEGGTTRESSIYQSALGLVADQTYTLSFWWKPGANAGTGFTLRLSQNGITTTQPARNSGDGLIEGYRVLQHLADQPFTQEFISVKLCRLFVHERFFHHTYDYRDPNLSAEGQLVKACMEAWENNTPKGQIRKVLSVIFNSELFRSQGSAAHKVKTPIEFSASALRALKSDNADGSSTVRTDGVAFKNAMERMGAMKLFDRAEPDGFPEDAVPWVSAGTLAERLRFVQSLCTVSTATGREMAGTTTTDPVALLKKKLPAAQWDNASAVADFFLGILFPGEGKANLDLYRTAAIGFLNTADNGTTASAFSGLGNTSATYDTRVRGLVAALMTSPRFHEQ